MGPRRGSGSGRVLGLVRRAIHLVAPSRRREPAPAPRPGGRRERPERHERTRTGGRAVATSGALAGVEFQYAPSMDGDPDPGEVVWTWVPYEDDPRQGKDRPVAIVGRRGRSLVGVALTSKRNDRVPQFGVGTGPWDREGRPSWAKLDRVIDVDPSGVRREGAVLAHDRYDGLVTALRREHAPRR
jgi:hypothetical protein